MQFLLVQVQLVDPREEVQGKPSAVVEENFAYNCEKDSVAAPLAIVSNAALADARVLARSGHDLTRKRERTKQQTWGNLFRLHLRSPSVQRKRVTRW